MDAETKARAVAEAERKLRIHTDLRSSPEDYWREFMRYWEMAAWQHERCNLGETPHIETPYEDELIRHVYLYDVVERKHAGFGQILLDLWHSPQDHPHRASWPKWRRELCESYASSRRDWTLEAWILAFSIHRLTGSGINYAQSPSGYCNSALMHLGGTSSLHEIAQRWCELAMEGRPLYTSKGYQIARFPPLPERMKVAWKRAGDAFIANTSPYMAVRLARRLEVARSAAPSFRECMRWLKEWHDQMELPMYWFQYGAMLADIADFFPSLIDRESHYFYGGNARRCARWLGGARCLTSDPWIDKLMDKIREATGMLPYNAEDVMCDWVRWIENYIDPRQDYGHLDLDEVWSSSQILDHPHGRQRKMLEMGLVESFNSLGYDPTHDAVLKHSGLTEDQYWERCYAGA